MHWFSSDAFLDTLAEVHFPDRPREVASYAVDGRTFRLLAVDGRPITEWPFLDFVVPVEDPGPVRARPVRFVPHAALAAAEIGAERPALPPGADPAPFIRWERFPDWAAFERHFAGRRSNLPRDSRQKRRNLEKDLGPVEFRWEDPRPETFDRCIAWKSAQYDRTGVVDHFRRPQNAQLFRALHAKGALVISSLSAGGTLLAVHFGARHENGIYSWIAAYDPERSRYSPGRLLLEDMLRECLARRHEEWDFGIGDMDYKWHYATHNRVIGALGAAPIATALADATRTGLKRVLERYPALLERARRLRKLVAEARPRA